MEQRSCQQCSKTFQISEADLAYYKKIAVPLPQYCPVCRQIQLMVWRNERVFYPASCAYCQRSMISCFSPKVPFPVICNECWWSSKFDPQQFGRDFDFKRPFFEQFSELLAATPVGNLFIANSENSEYTQLAVGNKNCYMALASDYNEDSLYLDNSNHNKDACDVSFTDKSELSYESVDLYESYSCQYSQNIKNSNNCTACIDCSGSNNLLGCVGIRNKSYLIFNQQYSSEEYTKRYREYKLHTYVGLQNFLKEFNEFKLKHFRRYAYVVSCEKSTGNYLTNSHNCIQCFDLSESEDCKYSIYSYKTKDAYDIYGAPGAELAYYSCAIPETYNVRWSAIIWPGSVNVYYSYLCRTARNCFGCVALHNNEYSILNKQYSPEEYERLLKKIKAHMIETGEWGNFFPMNISPWAYNETIAYDYYPIDKNSVQSLGARWEDEAAGRFGNATLAAEKIPPDINAVPDSIINEVLACAACSRNYKIVAAELKFYKKINVPLPRLCSTCRYHHRIALRNARSLWERQCMCTQIEHSHHGRCETKFETTYAPDRLEIIYCEFCYQKEVY